MAGAEQRRQVRFVGAAAGDAAEPFRPDEVAVVGSSWRCSGEGAALRWCISAALCAAFLGLGLSIAVLGPTFDNLAANVRKNVSDIYFIFVGRSLGYLGGSVLGGVLFDCMNAHLLIALSMFGTTAGLFAIPWCKEALLLTAFMSVIGAAMGVLDTGGNVLILGTWGAESGPHMQALHFSFAVGAFLAPLLAKMALGSSDSTGPPVAEQANQSVLRPVPTAPAATAAPAPQHHLSADFLWSYIVIGTYLLAVSVFFLVLYSKASSAQEKSQASVQKKVYARYHYALLGLLFFFFLFYVGAEVTYGSYIFTYAKVFAEMKDSEAATLNSVFWGAFAVCRALAIFCATCLYPGTMIVLSLMGSAVSSFCLVFFAGRRAALWLGTAIYGASMATVFPSGISWVEQYTVVQGKAASFFVVGASLGEMCIPAVVGYLQGRFHHVPVVMYTALGTSAMTVLLFPLMYRLAKCPPKSERKEVNEGEVCKALLSVSSSPNEDEEDEEDVAEWNEADFETIEMNKSLRDSVAETSQKRPGDSPAEVSLRSSLDSVLHTPPAVADGSAGTQEEDADQEQHD
ncbi:sodium-dependent glucose transporter 1 [Melanerpes formicivorus]|uniref:sodium-dependent glucose transporter 1 n=1 Tax=Melanerpes formicivorus TaxID=211600 RepID=UPI00358EE41A